MALIRKIPWVYQPPSEVGINRGSPLTNGLSDLFHVPAGRNIITGGGVVEVGTESTIVGSGAGLAWDSTATSGHYYQCLTTGFKFANCDDGWATYAHLINVTAFGSFGGPMAMTESGAQVGINHYFEANSSTLEMATSTGFGAQSVSFSNFGANDLPTDTWVVLAVTFPVTTSGGTARLYLNGVEKDNASFTPSSNPTDNNSVEVHINSTRNVSTNDMKFALGALWTRRLLPHEHAALGQNMWALFQPRTQILPFVDGGAPAPNTRRYSLTLTGVG